MKFDVVNAYNSYSTVLNECGGIKLVDDGKNFYFIDSNGKKLGENYSAVGEFVNGFAVVKRDNLFYFVDMLGNEYGFGFNAVSAKFCKDPGAYKKYSSVYDSYLTLLNYVDAEWIAVATKINEVGKSISFFVTNRGVAIPDEKTIIHYLNNGKGKE